MATSKITKREIETCKRRSQSTGTVMFLWDDELKGFGVRVSPSGKVSWIVKKSLGTGGRKAKVIKHVFGDYETTPLDQARDQAIALIGSIRSGTDLNDSKRRTRRTELAVYESGKFKDVYETYHSRMSHPGRHWDEMKQRFQNQIIPAFGERTIIANITKREIRNFIETTEETHPGAARRHFAALSPFFKWCVERELIAVSPMIGLTPPRVSTPRDRVLTDLEIKNFWTATDTLGWPFGPMCKMLLLTAQRRDEVAGMKWCELDLANATWTIPKARTKNSKEHTIHLNPQALAVLATIEKQESPYVFTTTLTTHASGYSVAKLRLDEIMQTIMGTEETLTPFRIHDLRRTAATGMARLGFMPHVIERVLNHVSGVTGGGNPPAG